MTRELFSTDSPVKLADLARGCAFFKLTAESHCRACAPRVGHRGTVKNTKLTASFFSRADAPIIYMSSQRVKQSPGSTPSYWYQGIQQCDANPVPAQAPTVIIRSYHIGNQTCAQASTNIPPACVHGMITFIQSAPSKTLLIQTKCMYQICNVNFKTILHMLQNPKYCYPTP